jgi:hypothetical protein
MAIHQEDWLSRITIPDLYPRREDPLRPAAAMPPSTAPPGSELSDEPQPGDVLVSLTKGGNRPVVVQDAINYTIPVGTSVTPLVKSSLMVDAILINVPSAAAISAFFGRGGITTTSGIEVRPGVPQIFRTDNTRELWELQRTLEFIAGILAVNSGSPILKEYRAPRVAFDASQYGLVASGNVTVAVMLFYIPAQQ